MKKSHLLVVMLAIGFIGSVDAALIEITATSADSSAGHFTIRFVDDGDELLSLDDDEVTFFSGVDWTSGYAPNDGHYDVLRGTPYLPGISWYSGFHSSSTFPHWTFFGKPGRATDIHISTDFWTYSSAPVTVPIPAAVWLFGSGLLGLIGMARRKKAA